MMLPFLAAGGAVPAAPAVDCSTAPPVLKELCDIAGGVGGVIADAPGAVAGSLGNSAVHAVTAWVIDGAVWFLDAVATAVTQSTEVHPTAAFFQTHYAVMAGIAAVVAVPLLLASIISAVLRGDPGRFGRALTMTFVAGLGTFAAVTVTGLLLAVTDILSAHIASGMGADLHQSLQGVGTTLNAVGDVQSAGAGGAPTGAVVPLFAGFLAAIVIVIGAVGVWLELVLREVAIYAALLFFPLALAGLVWDATARWARRLAEIIVSLILAKLVIVAVLSLGAAGLASGGQGFSGVVAGAALLILALFAPWVVMRLVGVAQVALAGTGIDGLRQRATSTMSQRTHQASDTVRSALGSSGGKGGGLTVAPAGGGSAGAAGAGAGAGAGAAGAGAGAAVAAPLMAAKAAADKVRAAGGRAVDTADAATNPYASPPRQGKKSGGGAPPVQQVQGRLGDERH
jgi:hypothetical protein